MKCYYVQRLDNSERRFFSSKREAEKFRRQWEKEYGPYSEPYIEEIHWKMSRTSIIDLLNEMAPNGDCPL